MALCIFKKNGQTSFAANLNCGLPPELSNGYYVIDNNTASYFCLPGFTANGQNNTAHCNGSTWKLPSITCTGSLLFGFINSF